VAIHSASAVTSSSGVDGRGEDRVVGALELVLDERPEHRRERDEKSTAVATVPVPTNST
jgi:hypothetical protein